uniref:Uncharacterized protein n=1 Tax=Knipowitschia caucasica TaxID=637954 RepID=A0AAV2LIT9_KNICA
MDKLKGCVCDGGLHIDVNWSQDYGRSGPGYESADPGDLRGPDNKLHSSRCFNTAQPSPVGICLLYSPPAFSPKPQNVRISFTHSFNPSTHAGHMIMV